MRVGPELSTLTPKVARVARWATIGAVTSGAQVAVQLAGFVAGVLVIRILTPHEYAYYTIAYTGLGTMIALSDGGISHATLAQAGAVWREPRSLGGVLAAGLSLRRRFAIPAAAVALSLVWLLLRRHEATPFEALLVALSIVPVFALGVTTQLLEIVPRLHQQIGALQSMQLANNVARAALVAAILPWWPLAAIATLTAAVPQTVVNWRLRRLASAHADWHGLEDLGARRKIVAQVMRTLPGSVFYAFSSQITVWLISVFGRTEAVAAVGALSRVAAVLNILGAVFAVLVVPRFSRLPDADTARVRRRYWQALLCLALVGALPVAAIIAFPQAVLSVLGPQYRDFAYEAGLMGASCMVAVLTAGAYSLGASRGIVANPWLTISVGIGLQAALIVALPIGTAAGVIWLGLLTEAGMLLVLLVHFALASRRGTRVGTPESSPSSSGHTS
jgi:O-antigen/teichoic acid export membrane protein